ncbi:MAG: hypothetical protein KGH86_01225 [Thaumarchaeota archaeon]|nr:hypothetical protein [Nitrososphaerota archaeon]
MTRTVNDTGESCFAIPEFDVMVLEVESIVMVVLGTIDEFVLLEIAVFDFTLLEITVLEFVLLETTVLEFTLFGITVLEFVLLETTVLELLEIGSIEKAYCGKTSTAITERKSRILRFISHDSPHSINKELIYIVQEQCHPYHE